MPARVLALAFALVATVAYEFIRLMANLYGNPVVRAILAPGLALQKMTTRPAATGARARG